MNESLHQEFDVDEFAFRRQQKAQARRASLAAKPETVEEMAATYNLSTDAANLLLAEHGLPPELRPFVDAVVGVSGDRVGIWFPASDETLASRVDKDKRTISRQREKYLEWMKKSQIALVDVREHKYQTGEVTKPHEYRVNFSRQVAETVLEAEKRGEWKTNKGLALEASAADVKASDLLPDHTTDEKRTRKPRRDAEALIKRKLRTMVTLGKKSLSIHKATGKNAAIDRDAFAELERTMTELCTTVEAQEGPTCDSHILYWRATVHYIAADAQAGADLYSNNKEELLPQDETLASSPAEARAISSEAEEGGSGHGVHNPPQVANESAACEEFIEGVPTSEVRKFIWPERGGGVGWLYPPDNAPPELLAAIETERARLKGGGDYAGG
jgi:hypothetical protein